MIKLVLFALLCGFGYRLVRSVSRGGLAPPERPPKRAVDRSRAVEAQFEEVDRDDGPGPPR